VESDALTVLLLDVAGTFLATLVGAAIALFGASWLHKRESQERYDDALDAAVAMLVEEASVVRRNASEWRRRNSFGFWRSRGLRDNPLPPDPAPSLARFLAMIDMTLLRAHGSDREALRQARSAADLIEDSVDEKHVDRAYQLALILLRWRDREQKSGSVAYEITERRDEWAARDSVDSDAQDIDG
jgi:hypothetical protein